MRGFNDYVPDVRFKRTSIVSTMRLNGDSVPFMFKGTLDGDLFIGYIENFLAPTLRKGDILVLDNASVHKKHEPELMGILEAEARFLPRLDLLHNSQRQYAFAYGGEKQ